jgi:hypothetical protein
LVIGKGHLNNAESTQRVTTQKILPKPLSVVRLGPHALDALSADLVGEHRTEPVPPEAHRLVADVDAALEQQVLDVPKRQRVPMLLASLLPLVRSSGC